MRGVLTEKGGWNVSSVPTGQSVGITTLPLAVSHAHEWGQLVTEARGSSFFHQHGKGILSVAWSTLEKLLAWRNIVLE